MSAPPELWAEVFRVLDEALNVAPSARGDWLDRIEAEAPDVASHVRRLLRAHERSADGDPLAGLPTNLMASALLASPLHAAAALSAGRMLGPYRLLTPIGEGGMASVWLAEQTANVKRRVALKIPHAGIEDTAAMAARFEHERDLLASLEHRHIARLYDAGIGADGTPYLAMEWIDGLPITQYADAHRLSIAQRVGLFRQVLQAVRHAHAHLVIHRDLKPSNILVTGEGQVKLLDFGIAGLLGKGESGEAGEPVGPALTPETASPEQLAGDVLATPSDVYSLGVVLYELLVGKRPYRLDRDRGDGTGATAHAAVMATVIAPPSRAARDDAMALARHSTVRALSRDLSGDLDAIVGKALMKQVAQRYDGSDALDADLVRWQERWPVTARRTTLGYRFGRFLKRNRVAVTAGCVVVVSLCTGLGSALWQADRARQESRLSQTVQTFLIKLFDASDPEQARGRPVDARELLARGAERLDHDLQDQPAVLARLQHEVGVIDFQLGDNVAARRHLERSLALYAQLGLRGSEDEVDAECKLGEVLKDEEQTDAARQQYVVCLDLAQREFGRHHRWRLPVRSNLAWMTMKEGHAQAAVDEMVKVLAEADVDHPGPSAEKLKSRSVLGTAYLELGDYAKARDVFAQVLQADRVTPGVERTDEMVDRLNLARADYTLQQFASAARELDTLVPDMDRQIGPMHDRTIKARALWAQAVANTGDDDRAVRIERENLDHALARPRIDEELLSLQRMTLAKILNLSARPAEGVPLATEGLAYLDRKYPAPVWLREVSRRILGDLQLQSGHIDDASKTLDAAIAHAERIDSHETNPSYADMLQSSAIALHARGGRGDDAAALARLERARSIYARSTSTINLPLMRCNALASWIEAATRPGDAAKAKAFQTSAAAYASALPAQHVARAELSLMQAELSRRAGDDSAARRAEAEGEAAWIAALHRPFEPPVVTLH